MRNLLVIFFLIIFIFVFPFKKRDYVLKVFRFEVKIVDYYYTKKVHKYFLTTCWRSGHSSHYYRQRDYRLLLNQYNININTNICVGCRAYRCLSWSRVFHLLFVFSDPCNKSPTGGNGVVQAIQIFVLVWAFMLFSCLYFQVPTTSNVRE